MDSEPTSHPNGLLLFVGVVGMACWYYKMFHASEDTSASDRSGFHWVPKNFYSVMLPSYSTLLILVPVVAWFGQFDPPKWLFICASVPVFLLLILCVVGCFPFKFPDCLYPQWQYAKRHGLLEEGKAGKKSSQNRDFGGVDHHMGTGVTMRVASGRR